MALRNVEEAQNAELEVQLNEAQARLEEQYRVRDGHARDGHEACANRNSIPPELTDNIIVNKACSLHSLQRISSLEQNHS